MTTSTPPLAPPVFDQLLRSMLAVSNGISDLLFIVGKPVQAETMGQLQDMLFAPFSGVLLPEQTKQVAELLMAGNHRLHEDLEKFGGADTSYSVEGLARFRVNVFKQNGRHAIVMRKLSSEVPSLDALNLPPIFREIIKEKTGIVLVTGGTGSGKTTTLAGMLNELNRTSKIHIVTLEDPIEFLHTHQQAAFSQRELGKDFPDFASGLRSALRQAPKVILVGEIRDRETMEIALTASETGHVVYSTMHTVSAGQTINRILGMFGQEEEQQVRQRLAETLRYVVSQRLVVKVGGGRTLVQEIMGNNMRTKEVLLYGENENRDINEMIEAGSIGGWQSFNQALIAAYQRGDITEESAILYSTAKNRMLRELDAVKKRSGVAAPDDGLAGLRLQHIEMPGDPAPKPAAAPQATPPPLRMMS
ncbi:MAG: type IV pilus twitching motility protein PilT [Chthoniobacteraceae bacterium]